MVTFRAHYDGRSILPDGPVLLEPGATFIVAVVQTPVGPTGRGRFSEFAGTLTRAEAKTMESAIEKEFERIEGDW